MEASGPRVPWSQSLKVESHKNVHLGTLIITQNPWTGDHYAEILYPGVRLMVLCIVIFMKR